MNLQEVQANIRQIDLAIETLKNQRKPLLEQERALILRDQIERQLKKPSAVGESHGPAKE